MENFVLEAFLLLKVFMESFYRDFMESFVFMESFYGENLEYCFYFGEVLLCLEKFYCGEVLLWRSFIVEKFYCGEVLLWRVFIYGEFCDANFNLMGVFYGVSMHRI